jgi:hypothetical protein
MKKCNDYSTLRPSQCCAEKSTRRVRQDRGHKGENRLRKNLALLPGNPVTAGRNDLKSRSGDFSHACTGQLRELLIPLASQKENGNVDSGQVDPQVPLSTERPVDNSARNGLSARLQQLAITPFK